jgi:hypothetical protein
VPSLLLHEQDPGWSPGELASLIRSLHDLGLISTPCGDGKNNVYRAGESFLGLVMFLGCSPQVQLEPGSGTDDQAVCSIRFHDYPEVKFLSAAKRAAARCRKCRTPVTDGWQPDLDTGLTCEHCGEVSKVTDLDWRQAAGFGRCFVEITGIYPHEAVPSDKLLAALADSSGGSWKYFFA